MRLELPASLELMDPLEEVVVRLVRSEGVSEDDAYGIQVAFHEALTNAVRHGCGCDRRHRIRVAVRLAQSQLRMLVVDPGSGFDPDRLPDPLAAENLSRGGGRGVFYMRRFADHVAFRFPSSGGTAVSIVKRLHRATGAAVRSRGANSGDGIAAATEPSRRRRRRRP
jgi:serine/threonine-protein kinase RsbW